MLHGNDLQDSFLHESVKKLGLSLVISEYALKYSELDGSICSLKIPKTRIRCHQTVPRFQNFPGAACPRTARPPPPPPTHTPSKAFAPTAFAFAPSMLKNSTSRRYRFRCYPSDTTLEKSVSQVIVTASNI